MNQRELNIISATAKGIEQALEVLRSDYGDHALSEAMCQLQEPTPRRLGSTGAGYYAMMLLAWKLRGSPDLFT